MSVPTRMVRLNTEGAAYDDQEPAASELVETSEHSSPHLDTIQQNEWEEAFQVRMAMEIWDVSLDARRIAKEVETLAMSIRKKHLIASMEVAFEMERMFDVVVLALFLPSTSHEYLNSCWPGRRSDGCASFRGCQHNCQVQPSRFSSYLGLKTNFLPSSFPKSPFSSFSQIPQPGALELCDETRRPDHPRRQNNFVSHPAEHPAFRYILC